MKNPVKKLFAKQSGSSGIEAELNRLERKLADHQRRRSEALQALAEARDERLAILDGEDDVIAAAGARVRSLMIEAEDLANTIADYQTAIGNARERLRVAQDTETRAEAAEKLDAVVKGVEEHRAEMEKGLAMVARAAKGMMAAVPAGVGILPIYYRDRPQGRAEDGNDMLSGREAVAAIFVEGLFNVLPEIFDRMSVEDGYQAAVFKLMDISERAVSYASDNANYSGLSVNKAIDTIIAQPLKKRAADIIAGEIAPSLGNVVIQEPYRRPPAAPEIEIVALEDFRFLDGREGLKPQYKCVGEGSAASIRDKVAQHAIARGAAALPGTPQAVAAIEAKRARKSGRGFGPSMEQHRDLGDPLGLQRLWEASAHTSAEVEEVLRAVS